MSLTKVHVISQDGELVATFIPQPIRKSVNKRGKGPRAPHTTPVPLPNQQLHEIELENAEAYYRERRVAELHRVVQERLTLK
jgi:hypothetical protein